MYNGHTNRTVLERHLGLKGTVQRDLRGVKRGINR
jgi:hypothetical protein